MRLRALAAVVIAAAAVAVGTASAISSPSLIRALEVSTSEVSLDGTQEPKAGDRIYATSALYGWAGTKRGKRIGRDEVLCTFTTVHFERGFASAFCTAAFFLPGGSISAQAFLRFVDRPQRFAVPVTGGTGDYANARGWIDIRDLRSGNSALAFHLEP
jgi:allene oxide cyclase-like protein